MPSASLRQSAEAAGMERLPFLGGERVRIATDLSRSHLARLDALKEEWGLPSRTEVLNRLLDEHFNGEG